MNNFNYDLTTLENMMVWERDIYVALIVDDLIKQRERKELERLERRNRQK